MTVLAFSSILCISATFANLHSTVSLRALESPMLASAYCAIEPSKLIVEGNESVLLGVLAIGRTAGHTRTLKNNSTGRVSLRVVRSSCPCVTVSLGEGEMAPGESRRITASTQVIAVSGTQAHWVTIEAAELDKAGNTVHTQRFDLRFSFEADIQFLVLPTQLWIAGEAGTAHERTVYVRSTALDALNIREAKVDRPGFTIKRTRRFEVPREGRPPEQVFAITLEGALDHPGIYDTELTFATDDPSYPICRVPVYVRVFDKWNAAPAGFAFILPPGSPATSREVIVSASGNEICPAARVELRTEDGRPTTVEGLKVSMAHDADPAQLRVTVHADPARLPDSAGVFNVALIDANGSVVRSLPLAWVITLPADAP